ncbi:hypothetical protein LTR84_008719 [Exophiala bonariae]|uniref:1-alkyl-2-acetylglycerophosphocholine esterase n=1 Tax=Exophiala bonariae TaxID=1690606 RepID=A0AAV9MXC9_9EURO|nr:hypothetical protein LTR84_008719 [Exophiala bonariae]
MCPLILLTCLLLSTLTQAILLPAPPGSANVHITHFPLTDTSRVDPFAPCCDLPRRLMVTLYQPATCEQTETITYIPPTSAAAIKKVFSPYLPNISLDNFELQVCPEAAVENDLPLLFFTPGYWAPRVVYAVMLQWVASLGFNILAIDHPYDGAIVEYPDGSYVEYANVTIPDEILTLLAPRVADVSTVLNAVTNNTRWQELGVPVLSTERMAVFGHSLGGATAVGALLAEPRLMAACNIDGGLWGDEITTDNDRPFLLIHAENHPASDTSWDENWPYQKGPKWHLEISGTRHNALTDFSILSTLLGTNRTDPAVEAFIGTIDSVRLLKILREYIAAFFHEILEGTDEPLLSGPSMRFPEVSFRNMSSGGG